MSEVYRGVLVKRWPTFLELSGRVILYRNDGTLDFAWCVIGCIPINDDQQQITAVLDQRWDSIMCFARELGIRSADAIPFEIHSIEDPDLRKRAVSAYLTP